MLPRGGCFQRPPRVSQNETHLSKSKICIVLKLFPNTSTVLEQMHVFKTSGSQNWLCARRHRIHNPNSNSSFSSTQMFPHLPPST